MTSMHSECESSIVKEGSILPKLSHHASQSEVSLLKIFQDKKPQGNKTSNSNSLKAIKKSEALPEIKASSINVQKMEPIERFRSRIRKEVSEFQFSSIEDHK